jgi:hypothetical protein
MVESRNRLDESKWDERMETRRQRRANRSMYRQSTGLPLAMATCLFLQTLQLCAGQTPDRSSTAETPTTAEELLEALRTRRPANDVIPPHSANHTDHVEIKLLPEGSVVINRPGEIALIGEWWMFTSTDGETKLRLLPNLTLETMVLMTQATEAPLHFSVSGELMVFEGVNYLLVRSAPRARAPHHEEKPQPAAPLTANTTAENPSPKKTGASSDDDPSDVLGILSKQGRDRPVIPIPPAEKSRDDRREGNAFAGLLDGSALVDRPCRITRQGDWWTLIFESDRIEHPELPMRLLPCSGTELMVRSSTQLVGGVVFRVSGEVTSFLGKNYLLPRAVTRRFASGNLRK